MDTPKETWPRFKPAGDSAVLVELGDAIDPAINRRVHALAEAINSLIPEEEAASPIGEAVPAYSSVLVQYDPLVMDYSLVVEWIQSLLQQLSTALLAAPRLVEIPTRYGGDSGPDLEFVARSHNLSPAEVIRIHSQAAAAQVKLHGKPNDLLQRVAADPAFNQVRGNLGEIMDARRYTGLAAPQTSQFLRTQVQPVLRKHRAWLGLKGQVSV